MAAPTVQCSEDGALAGDDGEVRGCDDEAGACAGLNSRGCGSGWVPDPTIVPGVELGRGIGHRWS
jgi:hypothetical protein